MNRHLFSVLLVLAMIGCGAVIFLLISSFSWPSLGEAATASGSVALAIPGGKTVYVSHVNVYEDTFRDPIEHLVITLRGGDIYIITTREEPWIDIHPSVILDYLKKHGKSVSDIREIVHNHHALARPSLGNHFAENYFRTHGCNPEFGIWYQPEKKIYWEPEK